MKKFAALLLAAVMTASLAACGSGDNNSSSDRDSSSRSGGLSSILGGSSSEDSSSSSEDDSSSSEANEPSSDSSNNSGSQSSNSGNYVYPDEDGWAEGYVGDTLRTYWFDFTVTDVHTYGSEYAGYEAASGYRLLAVDLTIVNTYSQAETPMFDSDFVMIWTVGDDDLDSAYPVENAESLSSEFLPTEFVMNNGDKVTGSLLFEVPEDSNDFGLLFTEYFADDSTGDVFIVDIPIDAYGNASGSYNGDIYYGAIGDVMSTYWFDFTVDSAVLYSEYAGNTPADGHKYLVLEVTMVNNFYEAVPMYDYDFDVEWEDSDSYELPVGMIVDGEELVGDEYELPYNGTVEVTMVYEVPDDYNEFIVYFDEYFANDTTGDSYGVAFIPEQR